MRNAGATRSLSGAHRNRASHPHTAPYLYCDANPDSYTHQFAHAHPDQHPNPDEYPDPGASHGHAGAADGYQYAPPGTADGYVHTETAATAGADRYSIGGIYWP